MKTIELTQGHSCILDYADWLELRMLLKLSEVITEVVTIRQAMK